MVLLVTTTPILSAFEAIPASSRKDLNLPDSLALDAPISHDQVIQLSRYFRSQPSSDQNVTNRSLDFLLRGMRVYIPPPPPKPEPSPEYLALKARLLAAAEADAYTRMTSSTPSGPSASAVFSATSPTLAAMHDLKAQGPNASESPDPLTPSLVLNIFLSVVITGFSVYWALSNFQAPEMLYSGIASVWRGPGPGPSSAARRSGQGHSGGGTSESVRVLLSFLVALAVGVAEVAIYAIYLGKIEQARSRERKFKERKEVVGSEEVRASRKSDSPVPSPTAADGGGKDGEVAAEKEGEEEIIWGRGPNGGLRRRVREKWEEDEMKKKNDQDGAPVS